MNPSKTKTMIVSRSLIMHPQSLTLTIGGTVLREFNDLVILGVTFASKMTLEKHLAMQSDFSKTCYLKEVRADQCRSRLPTLNY